MNTEIEKINNLSVVSTDDLKRELARGLEITAKHLVYLAKVWRELETRGEDLSDIRHGLLAYLPMIASESVEPSLVVNYAGQKTLLTALTTLPIETQRVIAETGHITIVNKDGDEVQTPVSKIKAVDIYRIIDPASQRILTPDEQRKRIAATSEQRITRQRITSIVGFENIDGDEVMVISGKRVKVNKVLNSLKKQYPELSEQIHDLICNIEKTPR